MKRNKEKYFELHGEEDAERLAEDMARIQPLFVGGEKKELFDTLEELVNPFAGSPFGELWTLCQKALSDIDVVKWIDTVVEQAETYYFLDVQVGGVAMKYGEVRDEGFQVVISLGSNKATTKQVFDWGIDDTYNDEFHEKIKKHFFDFLKDNQSTIEKYL